MTDDTIKLTILHSNDIHGDFLPSEKSGVISGGITYLSGYVNRVRSEEENVIYAIAGDLFMGSVVDRAYKGLSTVKLVNVLEPDVFEVGNHEVDYGLSHLLFLEKCADFPVICANMYVRGLNRRLFLPYLDISRGGLKIRFIGLLTESVSEKISQEELIESEISVRDVFKEIEKVFAAAQWDHADMTILLTHIGIEEDKKLARIIKSEWNVDMMIGGHSHSYLKEPLIVNGIPIIQAGVGSSQIGRLDLTFDAKDHSLKDYSWQLIPVGQESCEADPLMDFYLDRMQGEADKKYDGTLCTFPCEYEHSGFHRETQLIDLFADIYQDAFNTDVFFLSTNIIRCKLLGPVVTKKDLELYYPYDNEVFRFSLNGRTLERIVRHIYRKEAWFGAMIFFLFSGNLSVKIDKTDYEIKEILFHDKPLEEKRIYIVGITSYAYKNAEYFLGITHEEMEAVSRVSRAAINDREVLEGYFASHRNIKLEHQGRLIEIDPTS